jgi:hypothetical protein
MTTTGPTEEQTGVMAMNYNIKEYAREKIETITSALDDSHIKSRFDEPVDKAARKFSHNTSCPVNTKEFHGVIAEFTAHIYQKGLNTEIAFSEPLGYAIELLEDHYRGSYGTGYIAAALDANDPAEGGIDTVLNRLADIIKDIERQKYIKAVFAVNINPADWHLKCEIVSILLEDYRQFLPQHLLDCESWQLASQIQAIMYRYICSDSALQELLY